MNSLRFARISGAFALIAILAATASPASATTNGIKVYLSAPFVQGPSYTGADVTLETFDGYSPGTDACLGSSAIGTFSNDCSIFSGGGAGGAMVSDDTPSVNGSPSIYAATHWASPPAGDEINIAFPSPVQFIGLWWSAGNVAPPGGITNFIEFYSGDTLLLTITADDIMAKLGDSVPNPYPGTGTVQSVGGTDYITGYYYGHPVYHTSLTPTSKSSQTGDYPFVYLNLFTEGDTRVDHVVLGGDGFEFDNLTTATEAKTPTNDMVYVNEYADSVTETLGGGGSSNGGGSNGGSSHTTRLASTGINAVPVGAAGVVALAFGVVMLVVRRRTNATARTAQH